MSVKPIYFAGERERQDREKLIFVEGTDDAYFLDSILEEIGADPQKIGVLIVGGTGNFASSLLSYRKSSAFRRVKGVLLLRDADDNPTGAESEIKAAFTKAFGIVVGSGELSIKDDVVYGQFILPSGDAEGDLEKICLDTVLGTELHTLAREFIETAQGETRLTKVHKRTAQVFLAAIPDDLCRGAGMGFRKGFFDISHASLEPLKEFIKKFVQHGSSP